MNSQYQTEWGKAERISPQMWSKTTVSTFTTFINALVEVLAREIWEDKEMKSIQIGKEEVKIRMFSEGMILYKEKSKH